MDVEFSLSYVIGSYDSDTLLDWEIDLPSSMSDDVTICQRDEELSGNQ